MKQSFAVAPIYEVGPPSYLSNTSCQRGVVLAVRCLQGDIRVGMTVVILFTIHAPRDFYHDFSSCRR